MPPIRRPVLSMALNAWAAFAVGAALAEAPPNLQAGAVTPLVECPSAPGQSYALYLPSSYRPDAKWPILYVFDPGARGRLGVDVFRAAAESFGWIVACSNNSRNGPWAANWAALEAVWNDTHARLNIDPKRIYAAGFSGGVRVAGGAARKKPGAIAGVIGCGADFTASPGQKVDEDLSFAFFGIAGFADFNFDELKRMDARLEAIGVPHRLAVFDGEHDWPPPRFAAAAVEWLELHAMRAGRRERDDGLVHRLLRERLRAVAAADAAADHLGAFELRRELALDFSGLADVAGVRADVARLQESRAVKRALRERASRESRVAAAERELWRNYARVLKGTAKDATGPESAPKVIADIELHEQLQLLRRKPRADEGVAATRFVRGVWAHNYAEAQEALAKDDFARAAFSMEVAAACVPDDPGALFLLARVHARNADVPRTVAALRAAIAKGFTAVDRIEGSPEFAAMTSRPEFVEVLELARRKSAPPRP